MPYRRGDVDSKLKPPPPEPVDWEAKPNGQYYDFEEDVSEEVAARRLAGVTVTHKLAHRAMREACILLQLAPEHIDLKVKDERRSGSS